MFRENPLPKDAVLNNKNSPGKKNILARAGLFFHTGRKMPGFLQICQGFLLVTCRTESLSSFRRFLLVPLLRRILLIFSTDSGTIKG
jgi:hypothetical protein